jgi:hypothetical protein
MEAAMAGGDDGDHGGGSGGHGDGDGDDQVEEAAPVMGCYGGPACQEAGKEHGCYDCHRGMTEAECKKADGSAAPFSDVAASGNLHMCVQKMGCYGGPACGGGHGCYDCTSPHSAECPLKDVPAENVGMCYEDHMTGVHKGGCFSHAVDKAVACVFDDKFVTTGSDEGDKAKCEAMSDPTTHMWIPDSSSCTLRLHTAGCHTGKSNIYDDDGKTVIHPRNTVYCAYGGHYDKDELANQLKANNNVAEAAGHGKDAHAAPLNTKTKCEAVGATWMQTSDKCKQRIDDHDASVSGCYHGAHPDYEEEDFHKVTCKKEGPHVSEATCPIGQGGARWTEKAISCGHRDPDKLAAYECVEGMGCYNRLSHACECPTGPNAVFVDGLPIGSLRDDKTNTCDDAEEKSDNTPKPSMTKGCKCECFCGTEETGKCGEAKCVTIGADAADDAAKDAARAAFCANSGKAYNPAANNADCAAATCNSATAADVVACCTGAP